MTNVLETLDYLVKEFSTFENFISHLKEVREINRKIIYDEKKYNKEAWDNVVQIDTMLENLDILSGNIKLEDIQEAARTFKRYENK
jgi:hypothetical protein